MLHFYTEHTLMVTIVLEQKILCEVSGSYGSKYEDDSSSGMLCHLLSWKLTNISEMLTASITIALMMEVVNTV
jgi:hypothetical protein